MFLSEEFFNCLDEKFPLPSTPKLGEGVFREEIFCLLIDFQKPVCLFQTFSTSFTSGLHSHLIGKADPSKNLMSNFYFFNKTISLLLFKINSIENRSFL